MALVFLLAATPDPAWRALDLVGGTAVASPGSFRFAAGLVSREALEGELDLEVSLAREPRSGLGATGAVVRYLGAETSAGELRLGLLFRAGEVRGEASAVRRTWGAEASTTVRVGAAARVAPGLLVAARVEAWPGAAEVVEIVGEVVGASGPWWGTVGVGPRAGDLRIRVAIATGPALRPWVGWSDGRVTFALALVLGPAEVRGAQTRHELLGRVDEVRLAWGGRP